jgi:hypothetical protein
MFSPCSEEIYGDLYLALKEKLKESGLLPSFLENQVDSSLLSLIYRHQFPIRLSLITSPSSALLSLLQAFGQKYYSLVRLLFNGPEEIVEYIVSRINVKVELPSTFPLDIRSLDVEQRRKHMLLHFFGDSPIVGQLLYLKQSDNTLLLCVVMRYISDYNVLADVSNSTLLVQCFLTSHILKETLPLRWFLWHQH